MTILLQSYAKLVYSIITANNIIEMAIVSDRLQLFFISYSHTDANLQRHSKQDCKRLHQKS